MAYYLLFLLFTLMKSDTIFDYSEKGWTGSCQAEKNSPIDIPSTVTNSSSYLKIISTSYPMLNGIKWSNLNSNEFFLNLTSLSGYLMVAKNDTMYKYMLEGIKLHSPAEHSIRGQKYELELQIIHKKDTNWLTITGIKTDPDEKNTYLIISVLYTSNSYDTNTILAGFDFANYGNQINSVDISSYANSGVNFYHYEGSQTVPSCDENVNWMVLDSIQNMTNTQYSLINSLIIKIYPKGNARTIKPLNSRTVYYTNFQSNSDSLNFSMIILAVAVMFLIFFFRKKFDII
jgi:carbonic anhydrase